MVEYSAAKAAVVDLTTSLAGHLAGSGVAANCSNPAPGTRPTRASPTRSGAASTAGTRPARSWRPRRPPHSPQPARRTSSSCWLRTREPHARSCAS
ncbi:hypothetical protein [Streptomyces sp. NBC_01591]|uniref:hypothetical protein n=1 Tax=Streptomyces sp. NBC_01591 TaxID=2975888 RepID=UPI003FA3AA91